MDVKGGKGETGKHRWWELSGVVAGLVASAT